MILLWGIAADAPIMMVRDALLRAGAEVAFLDQQAILDTEIDLTVAAEVQGRIRLEREWLEFGDVQAAYIRPYDGLSLPQVAKLGLGSAAWYHAASVEDLLLSWAEMSEALVVNRPSAMAANYSKPYQAEQIRALGFDTPDTLISTDQAAVLEFRRKHGTIIYKSVSGTRSVVTRLEGEQLERLDDLVWCPTQFQQYIAGTEYRVHVVGNAVFACEILSTADDYRYAAQQGGTVEIRRFELARDLADKCVALTAGLGLSVSGIDLRRTAEGRWYCLEVNPSPGFSVYQEAAQLPIDAAVASLLMAATA